MRILQMVFCIMTCLCVAASALVGAFCGLMWFFILFGVGVLFALLMLFAKKKATPPPPPKPDFMDSPEEKK